MPERIGIDVTCIVCGRTKVPNGRSIPAAAGPYCGERDCEGALKCSGYLQEPMPGDLWPGERESDFGFKCSRNATREVEDGDE